MAQSAQNKAMSYEARKKKWPTEYSLRENYTDYLEGNRINEATECIYHGLKKLAVTIIAYKYGIGPRIDHELLSHEISTSLMMTIVVRRKEVFSWTNLMKKVVRDYVSNYLRINGRDIVSLDNMSNDHDSDDDAEEIKFDEAYVYNAIRPEDIIYLEQIIGQVIEEVRFMYTNNDSIRSHLLFRMAVYELTVKKEHVCCQRMTAEDARRYNYYLSILQFKVAPIINNTYLSNRIYD